MIHSFVTTVAVLSLTGLATAGQVAVNAVEGARDIGARAGIRTQRPSDLMIEREPSGRGSSTLQAPTSGNLMIGLNDLPPVLPRPGLYRVTVWDTPTGYLERFLIYLPDVPRNRKRPLLVAFHSYSHWEDEIVIDTTYLEEAQSRNWYLLAPLGVHDYATPKTNFGSWQAQSNTDVAIDWVLQNESIDLERVYAVGFSMGGGWMTTYAARHLDPTQAMFAAIVNHTGSVALRHSYNVNPGGRSLYDYIFGGSPADVPFRYQRCSTVNIEPSTLELMADTSMVRNLSHVAVRSHFASDDPLDHLVFQNTDWEQHLETFGGELMVTNPTYGVHTWESLDETEVCDWFATKTLQMPHSAKTMADRPGKWFYFDVVQGASGIMTPFTWNVMTEMNRLYLYWTKNLTEIGFDTLAAGLDPTQEMTLIVQTDDATGDDIVLHGFTSPPSDVQFDFESATTWTHDPAAGTLRLAGTGYQGSSAFHQWTIVP